jgi:Tol biopolymer transport system component
MALTIGSQLGSHEIIALLGKGGMGEVYRARDLKLKREVAIKILPEEFARDADRVSRFQREAEVLASLNHNNIAAIYDLQEVNGRRFLVLELVEGEALNERLSKGPLPIGDVLHIAQRICEALEAAHEKGVVHRDLKPSNIKQAPDGDVKVLDFGLAKMRESERANVNVSSSPTMVTASSMPGMILGTAAYMSPEQARGRSVDRRTDIFAFGCVLFVMLTGRSAFGGEDLTETLGRVLASEPDWRRLPANTPNAVGRLLRRALQKDVRHRLSDIRDARLEIEDALREPTPETTPPLTARSAWLPWLVAAMAVVAAVIAIYFVRRAAENAGAQEMRLNIATPFTQAPLEFALSPDSRYIVFVGSAASSDHQQRLWLRALAETDAKPIPGTEGAAYPFWSPDSQSVGYFAFNKLYRIDISSGSPQVLVNGVQGRGGTWNADGTILYAPGTSTPIFRIPASGGDPVAVTRLSGRQSGHRFPQFLPDGHHFLLFAPGSMDFAGIYLASIDSGEPKRLTTSDTAGSYLPAGYVVFVRQGALVARHLDLAHSELTGDQITLAGPIAYDAAFNIGGFSVSREGRVAYRASTGGQRQLKWYDRTGKAIGIAAEPDGNSLLHPELSHDERRVAVTRSVLGKQDIWILDLLRGSYTRLTSDQAIDQYSSWSPDDMQIAFQSIRKGTFDLYRTSARGSGADEEILETSNIKSVSDWSRDGRFLIYAEADPATGRDLWFLDLTANPRMAHEFVRTPFEERNGQFSPDGHFVAYETNESGRFEIVVEGFPGQGPKFPVSTDGGTQARWSADGKELYFISPDGKLMAARVTLKSQGIEPEKPSALFSTHIVGGGAGGNAVNRQEYAVSREGHFLINEQIDDYVSPITLVLNWKPKS